MLDFRRTLWALWLGTAVVGMLGHTPIVLAQIAVSANDNKLMLVNGAATVVQNPAPDTVAIIDLKPFPPKIIAEIEVPASVVGPPLSVAITPDESLALVTAAMKIDPNDATKQVPDNRLSVIDLKASPPAVIATLETGKGPAGLSKPKDSPFYNANGKVLVIAWLGEKFYRSLQGGRLPLEEVKRTMAQCADTVMPKV